jgi:outer membrane immunogenic protein
LITGPNEITGANATASSAIDTHGGVFGGQVGCNYQFASNWVVGVEGSLSGTDVKGSITDPIFGSGSFISVKTDMIGSAVARLGFTAMNNHALFYVKGGIAGERNKWSSSPLGFLGAEDRLGWTAGAGVEWAFTRVWSVFLDYSHYEFGQNGGTFTVQNSFFGGPIFLSSDSLTSTGGHLDVVKVGVNLKLFGR